MDQMAPRTKTNPRHCHLRGVHPSRVPISRDHHLEKTATKKPFARLLLTPLFYLILGMGLLATEFYYINVNADRDLDLP